jgi:hypothetical protein
MKAGDAIPSRIAALPIDPQRGLPVPWFVHWTEDGKPDFRIIGEGKFFDAIRFGKCWVCGKERGRHGSFVLGPMSTITRTTAEPACHRECAIYSATACPFLSKPHMHRRDVKGYDDVKLVDPGLAIKRNPGVAVVWTTRKWKLFPDDRGHALIEVGDPDEVLWFAEGREATRAEVAASIEGGFPILDAECDRDADPAKSRELLAELRSGAERYLPKGAT